MTRRDAIVLVLGSWASAGAAQLPVRRVTGSRQGSAPGITALPLSQLVARLRRGELTPVEVVEAYLQRIGQLDPDLHAYVTVTADRARADAHRLAASFSAGGTPGGSLSLPGVPIAHKDLFDTAGVRTTGGSRLYADRVPSQDAALVARLRAAGAVTLGKTNTHELGGGVTTINPFFGTTRNPRDRARVPGGSSGGSAAAVAADLAAAATGSDTGGSIRIPAAFCGCVGFKPTHGLIDTTGLLGASPTFDHAGFLARTASDIQMLLDATTRGGAAVEYQQQKARAAAQRVGVRGLRVGVPRRYFFDRLDDAVARAMDEALSRLRVAGADIRDVTVPVDEATMARAFDPIVVSEIRATYREAWQRHPDAFSKDFAAIFEVPLPSPDELAVAHRARRRFETDMAAVVGTVDVLVTPTVPVIAPRIDGPIDGARILRNTWPFNAARAPALSVPCSPSGTLPVGLQIVGAPYADQTVLDAGAAVQSVLA